MIEVGRNSLIIRDVDVSSPGYKKFYNAYSRYDKLTFKYTFNIFTLIGSSIFMPASVDVKKLTSYFPMKKVVYNYSTTTKDQPISVSMKNFPRDDLQSNSLNFIKKMDSPNSYHEAFLALKTNSGKTFVSISAISYFKMRSIIIVDTIELANQWKAEVLKHMNIDEQHVKILSGVESVNNAISNNDGYIYIALHRTLGILLGNNPNTINILMNKLGIGFRIFDEAHVSFANICKINSLSNVKYTLYLTATPRRSDFKDNALYEKVFKMVPVFEGLSGDYENYHTVIMSKFNSNPPINVSETVKTQRGFSIQKWSSYINEGGFEEYFKFLMSMIKKMGLLEKGLKIAIMLPSINLIEQTRDRLIEEFGDVGIGLFIGKVKPAERKDQLQQNIILTNDKIFDKAIDVQDLDVLFNFVPLSSLVKIEQIIGRLRYRKDRESIFIDVTDEGFRECVMQSKTRKRFYKTKAKKIINLI